MEKMINIDGKEMRLVANGATPLVYRRLFGKDVFRDAQNVYEEKDDEIIIKDLGMIENLTFCMCRQGGSIPTDVDLETWLESLDDPMAIVNVVGEVFNLWTANQKKTSVPKTRGGKQTAH